MQESIRWYSPTPVDLQHINQGDVIIDSEELNIQNNRVLKIPEVVYSNIKDIPSSSALAPHEPLSMTPSLNFPFEDVEKAYIEESNKGLYTTKNFDALPMWARASGLKILKNQNPFTRLAKTLRRARKGSSTDEDDDEMDSNVTSMAHNWESKTHAIHSSNEHEHELEHSHESSDHRETLEFEQARLRAMMRTLPQSSSYYQDLAKDVQNLSIKLAHLHEHSKYDMTNVTIEQLELWIEERKKKMDVAMASDSSSAFGKKLSADIRDLDRKIKVASSVLKEKTSVSNLENDIESIKTPVDSLPNDSKFSVLPSDLMNDISELQHKLSLLIESKLSLERDISEKLNNESTVFKNLNERVSVVEESINSMMSKLSLTASS